MRELDGLWRGLANFGAVRYEVELEVGDRGRKPSRAKYADPGCRFKACNHFADGRQIRKRMLSLRGGDAVGPQHSSSNLSRARDEADEHEIDLAAEHVGQPRCRRPSDRRSCR